MEMVRCTLGPGSEMSLRYREWSRQIGAGAQVDLDEPVGDGLTVRDLVRGRESCFAPITQETPEAEPRRVSRRHSAAKAAE
jgi:hypothetical protein